MDGNTTNHRRKSKLLRGKTKHILLALAAILFLTCILVIPLTSAKFQAYPILANSENNMITTLEGTSSNGMSLVGNMTTIGNTTLNGLLEVSQFQNIILGPLTTTGSQNITASSIEINKPTTAGDTITLTGSPSSTTKVTMTGNINIGQSGNYKRVSMNMSNFYQYVNSNGTGYIGTVGNDNDLPLNTKDCIKVTKGALSLFGWVELLGFETLIFIRIEITPHTIKFEPLGSQLLLAYTINLDRYGGVANVSYLKQSGAFVGMGWLLSLFISDVQPMAYLLWDEPTIFEAWGPWFALERGRISMADSYVQMKSNSSINFKFLDSFTDAGLKITPSAHYSKAVMNATTQQQVVNGKGYTYLTNGSTSLTGATIKNLSQMINCKLTFQGNMTQTGNITVQGNIGIIGRNYMKGNINIRSPLLRLTNGVMDTTGTMNINSGAISIPTGTMIMNSTGSFITGNTITVTGNIDFNGNATITGDIGITGRNYMQGNITVAQLSLKNGVMDTTGTMNITTGKIIITGGRMVMNSSGSFIMGGSTTVSGTISFKGDPTITGDISLSGYNYMQGLITVQGNMNINNGLTTGNLLLTIDGIMETDGNMAITNGAINLPGTIHMVMNSSGSYIIGSTISVTGEQIVSLGTTIANGDITIQGDIGINGRNYMQGNIKIRDPLLNLNGIMDTAGTMTIVNGAIGITGGRMVMNSSGSFIMGDTITVTGIVDFNGDATITGDIGINGRNYMQGNINVAQIRLTNGVMDTDGTMNIVIGKISITGGHMVMNSSGSFIMGGSTTVTGNVDFTGTVEINSNYIVLSGHNYMQGNITVQGNMNINNGLTTGKLTMTINGIMETDGNMAITNGAINLPGTIHMVMNSSGSYIIGSTISVTGKQITSLGTTIANGDVTIQGDIAIGGTSYIKGPVSITGTLNINSGTMTGTGTITVSDGYMQTVGSMQINNAIIKVQGKIVMDSFGTRIGSTTSITGDAVSVNGIVTNAGSVKMTGTFLLMVPLSITGLMVTNGITAMGSLGAINGVMNVMGNIIMSGMTVISGDNNIMGSMTVMPSGVTIYGLVGLTGVVYTSNMPSIGPTTILELLSGSMIGLPIPHMSILMNPLALVALGILGMGTVYVVGRIVYFGIKERRTLIQLVRIYGREIGRSVKRLFRGRSRAG